MPPTDDLIEIVAVVGFIAMIGAGIVFGINAMQDAAPLETTAVSDEYHQPTDTDGITASDSALITADNVFEGHEVGSESVVFYDASAATNTTLTESQNYSALYSDGQYNITDIAAYNSSEGDALYLDYTYLSQSEAQTYLGDSIDAFDILPSLLEVLVVFGFLAVLIGLLWYAMGRMGLGRGVRSNL